MIDLTDNQIEMLYKMSDIQYKWFIKFTPESEITYDEVLRLNHTKMSDICSSLEGFFRKIYRFDI